MMVLLSPLMVQAQQLESNYNVLHFGLSGYYKNLFVSYKTNEYYTNTLNQHTKVLLADINRIRLSPELQIGSTITFHADIDNECIASNYTKSKTFDGMYIGYDYNELYPYYWDYRSEKLYYRLKLHRAFCKMLISKSTLTIGRQLIRFGSGKIWNPLDIINPISPLSFEGAEEVTGVNALRAEVYPSDFFEIGFVYVPLRVDDTLDNKSFSNSVYLSRNKIVIGETEVAFMFGRVFARYVAGIDASTIVNQGIIRASVLCNKDENRVYYLSQAGYEYSFQGGLNLLVEYFYNGNSLSHADMSNAYNESFLFGMNQKRYQALAYNFLTYNAHYGGVSVNYYGASLISVSVTSIMDFQGRGIMLIPSFMYNIFENCDITLYILYAIVTSDKLSDFSSFDNNPLGAFEVKYYF